MKVLHRAWLGLNVVLLGLVPLVVVSTNWVQAQTEESPVLDFDPPDTETEGFERSDLGNVVQAAKMECAEGNRSLAQARKIRQRLAETEDTDKKAKLEAKLQETYQSAASSFTDAIGFAPKMAEAYAGLGETLRDWGQLEKSLEVYAAAVRRFPDDLETFEGWATTLMELNMLGNATSTYTSYVETNPDRAAILMEVMQDWLKRKQADPGDLNPADVDRLAEWIQQQGVG